MFSTHLAKHKALLTGVSYQEVSRTCSAAGSDRLLSAGGAGRCFWHSWDCRPCSHSNTIITPDIAILRPYLKVRSAPAQPSIFFSNVHTAHTYTVLTELECLLIYQCDLKLRQPHHTAEYLPILSDPSCSPSPPPQAGASICERNE